MNVDMSRLCLGTAQLGMDYGCCNTTGKPNYKEARDIIETAWEWGIEYFDTAQVYGDSEVVLGKVFKELRIENPKVVTKIKIEDPSNVLELKTKLHTSLSNLKMDKVWGLLVHGEEPLKYEKQIAWNLKRSELKTTTFGYSCYSVRKAKELIKKEVVDVVQIPFNIKDQRALFIGLLDDYSILHNANNYIFVRSIFLQGKLIKSIGLVPCLDFVLKNTSSKTKIVVGVETKKQLLKLLRVYSELCVGDIGSCDFDLDVVDPRKWKKEIIND